MMFLEHVGLLVTGLAGFAIWPNVRGNRSATTLDAVQGIPCDLTQRRASRGNKVWITVALPCDERFEFTLRRERFADDLAKTLGLVREFQTQDKRFDEAVYIEADEPGIDDWLAKDAEVREALLNLLSLEPQECTRVTAIIASRGRITLHALANPPMFERAPDDTGQVVATACLASLKSCADRLRAFASENPDPTAFRDPYAVAVRTLSFLSSGLVLVPLLYFLLAHLSIPRVELATNPLWEEHSLVGTAIVVCGLAALAVPLLWGSTRLHTVLVRLLLCGALGTVVSLPALVRELNMEWDRSIPRQYSTHVLRRYETHGKGGAQYHVWLAGWHSESDSQELRVDEATYDQMQRGGAVIVTERAGYLGQPWVSELTRDWADEGVKH
jgi:hypothetical protein